MKLIDLSVKEFLLQVSSSSPAPGGGSVAALSGACGVGLIKMTLELSISKKKFLALDAKIQEEVTTYLPILQEYLHDFVTFIDEDTDAFNQIMKSFSLPKITDEEKAIRKQAILQGTIQAIHVPQKVIDLSQKAIGVLDQVTPYLNQNTLSDQGVAALCLATAIEGAAFNVFINLPSLEDSTQKETIKEFAKNAIHFASESKKKYMDHILASLT
ncbi:MAG: cyclodeaminase/cyclohydrolase family protein [bacterium]|nr:cyclodeaminase/cyclohydrolase family protein [bacterium]